MNADFAPQQPPQPSRVTGFTTLPANTQKSPTSVPEGTILYPARVNAAPAIPFSLRAWAQKQEDAVTKAELKEIAIVAADVAGHRKLADDHSIDAWIEHTRELSQKYAADPSDENRKALMEASALAHTPEGNKHLSIAATAARERASKCLFDFFPTAKLILTRAGQALTKTADALEKAERQAAAAWDVPFSASPLLNTIRAKAALCLAGRMDIEDLVKQLLPLSEPDTAPRRTLKMPVAKTLALVCLLCSLAMPARAQVYGWFDMGIPKTMAPSSASNLFAFPVLPIIINLTAHSDLPVSLRAAGSNTCSSAVTVAFATSLDTLNWDTNNLLFLSVPLLNSATFCGVTNFNVGAVGWAAPYYVTNANGVAVTNIQLLSAVKPTPATPH